jgi:hypothetical protein
VPIFKAGESLVQSPGLHAVTRALDACVFGLDGCHELAPVSFQLGSSVVVPSVSLNFCERGRVVKASRRFGQGVVGAVIRLEECDEPERHRGGWAS